MLGYGTAKSCSDVHWGPAQLICTRIGPVPETSKDTSLHPLFFDGRTFNFTCVGSEVEIPIGVPGKRRPLILPTFVTPLRTSTLKSSRGLLHDLRRTQLQNCQFARKRFCLLVGGLPQLLQLGKLGFKTRCLGFSHLQSRKDLWRGFRRWRLLVALGAVIKFRE
jgi:hypothetical protein